MPEAGKSNDGDLLHRLAEACGIERHWRDVEGRDQAVADDTLVAVIERLGHPTGTERKMAGALRRIEAAQAGVPAMIVSESGMAFALPAGGSNAEATGEDGATVPVAIEGGLAIAPEVPGYYDLAVAGAGTLKLAVAPHRCPQPLADRPGWGASVQIPALRGIAEREFGNLLELDGAVRALAGRGADAVAINPLHALFPGNGVGFSPYSPSSRRFLNSAMGDPALVGLAPLPERAGGSLIDWEGALPRRLADLRALFSGLDHPTRAKVLALPPDGGEAVLRHATFDALDCRFRPEGLHGWREWPARYRHPEGAGVARFAAQNRDEVEFHLFLQWLARESLARVGRTAREGGMRVGLIADLAVGVDSSGSDTWSQRDAMLDGLTIGAPPDPLGPLGQNWCLSGFYPDGLRQTGYTPWIALLRSAFASCGGLRIDHAFGLARLWVIPEGGGPGDGAYLAYPFADLVRLATLEAHRASAMVIAEDLGTSPPSFTAAIEAHGMPGMQVMWFQRAEDHGFIGAHDYARTSVAMTGTHDTATVAGWWSGRDLDWAERLGRLPPEVDRVEAEAIRAWDRGLLWSTIGDGGARPDPSDTGPVVDAAIRHVAATPAPLAVVPVEDLLGLEEQPNLPGTIAEHPNWRRRLDAPLDDLLSQADVARRTSVLSEMRSRAAPGASGEG